jgi:small-conductance mechanosensitive channel
MDARRWSGTRPPGTIQLHHNRIGALPTMTAVLAAFGILLIVLAIPFGLMLAPLFVGVLLVWFGLRRLADTLRVPTGGAPA